MRIRAPTDTPAPAFPDPRPPPGHRRTAPQPGPAGAALTPGRAPPPGRPPAGASDRGRRPGRAAARTRSGPRPRGRRRRAPGRASTRCLAEASAASPSGPRPTASAVIPSPWPGRRHCRGSASGSGRRRRCPTRPRARALPPFVGGRASRPPGRSADAPCGIVRGLGPVLRGQGVLGRAVARRSRHQVPGVDDRPFRAEVRGEQRAHGGARAPVWREAPEGPRPNGAASGATRPSAVAGSPRR